MNASSKTLIAEHERAVQRHYDAMTRKFYLQWNPDHIHLGLFGPGECPRRNEELKGSAVLARALERMVDVVTAPADINASHHVVDAGCGVGGTAVHLARTRGCKVTGVNISRLQLDMAAVRAQDVSLGDRLSFIYGDCSRALPFDDASVDVVVNIESARHYSDRAAFLREVYRILKPGGKLVASDWVTRSGLSAAEYTKLIQPICDAWLLFGSESQATYTRLLHDAGLKTLEFRGFAGRETDNLKIFERNYQSLSVLRFCGLHTAPFLEHLDRMEKIYVAWRDDYFSVMRYCAVKPT